MDIIIRHSLCFLLLCWWTPFSSRLAYADMSCSEYCGKNCDALYGGGFVTPATPEYEPCVRVNFLATGCCNAPPPPPTTPPPPSTPSPPPPPPSEEKKGFNIPLFIGCVLGISLALALTCIIIACCINRRRMQRQVGPGAGMDNPNQAQSSNAYPGMEGGAAIPYPGAGGATPTNNPYAGGMYN